MEKIGKSEMWSFLDDADEASHAGNEEVRRNAGRIVRSYIDLAKMVAELQFRNQSQVLLFRGQSRNYKDENGLTSLKPSIFRQRVGSEALVAFDRVKRRYKRLKRAEKLLSEHYRENVARLGNTLISRYRIVRWALLQHYDVCRTPLLDVTHSLRIAASFASMDNDTDEAYLYVLGVPAINGAITVSVDAGIQIARLTSVCPPTALRPHLQEGYLIGEYPDISEPEQKSLYPLDQVDFGLRLVAKFRFNPITFWNPQSEYFPQIKRRALYPAESHDPIHALAAEIKQMIWTPEA